MPHYSLVALRAALFPLLLLTCAVGSAAEDPQALARFNGELAPLLVNHCLECHNASDKKGELDLTSLEGLLTGGDSGAALVPGKPEDSPIWQRVEAGEMPPEKHAPLTDAEKQILKQWISDGAQWPGGAIDPLEFTTAQRAGYDWWSLKPITTHAPPTVKDQTWVQQPLDAFVLAKLEAAGLIPSPRADRRTLIRRVTFDLTGLPPTPEEVAAFVEDESPDAYPQLVERLLASPHYGEHWARHWLDLARFGESQGFERDKLRPNAWPYRDWVIHALNDDMPYDEFVRRQLAGDVLYPADPTAAVATGFLVSGPYDEVGQTQQSLAMRAVVRQDELEDLVGTTSQTFLGLTVNCARCHDHKFDPISHVDYYRIASAISGIRHGERQIPAPAGQPEIENRLTALRAAMEPHQAALAAIEQPARARVLAARGDQPAVAAAVPFARWEFNDGAQDSLGNLHGTLFGGAEVADGRLKLNGVASYVSTPPLERDLAEKTLEAWLMLPSLDQRGGGVISVQTLDGGIFDAIVYGERQARRWVPGSNGYVRTQDLEQASNEEQASQELVHVAITYAADGTITTYRNGIRYGAPYKSSGLQTFAPGAAQVIFGLRHSPAVAGRMLSGSIDRAQLYDRALSADEVAASAGLKSQEVTTDELLAALSEAQRQQRAESQHALSLLQMEERLLAGGPAYVISPQQPEVSHRLLRGETRSPAEVVVPGGVAVVAPAVADFGLAADAPEGERRKKLAAWITSPENPLAARVMANRIWHYHFGVGIVDTPNDFGFNGGRPSHPELLDHLASELREHGWSIKHLHRQILLSATYQQASLHIPTAAKIDAGNRLLWRKSPLRLEAEMVRDAVLHTAGQLNPRLGGAGYRDFRTFDFNSQFYENVDQPGFEQQRRSIYRTWVRSGTNPLLDVLDCPDPSTTTPARAVTTTPLQALALLNNSFMFRMADHLAERAMMEAGTATDDQIRRVYQHALVRQPHDEELAAARGFVNDHGLPALCRVVLNSNEFLYID